MKRNLIIVGGGFLQVPLIETARSMGLHAVVFDMSTSAPGMRVADERVIMSTRDIEGCVREARKLQSIKRIHGVITAGTDASRAVAAIAGALELAGIRFSDAEAASNKVLMRKRLQHHDVPIPRFASVWSLQNALEAAEELTFPLVLKPAENMGARGVIKIETREELENGFSHTRQYSPTGEMILEEYMEGPELSVDALAWNGQIRITGIADRIIAREPYFVELGHNMPSRLGDNILQEAEWVMKKGMRALGIHTGAGKGDLKVTRDGVKVGEIAARLSGGFMSSHTYPLHSGVNLFRNAIRIALGEEPDELDPVRDLVAVERGILSPPGEIIALSGREEMEAVEGIELVHFSRKRGDTVPRVTSNIDKVGHIVAVAPTLEEAEERVREALERLRLAVNETPGLDWKSLEERARQRLGESVCRVCRVCDGNHCASSVPGMGGVGRMITFQENVRSLEQIRLLPRYIRDPVTPRLTAPFFRRSLSLPVMAAPMTGTSTNMNDIYSEKEFASLMIRACHKEGTVAWLGDGASPDKYLTLLEAVRESEGDAVIIFKPREELEALQARFRAAEEAGVLAVGMDLDSLRLKTMTQKNQRCRTRNARDLRELRAMTSLPFIVKGVLTVRDALAAREAGADAIVVSNHGGRVLDSLPATARVLPGIAREMGEEFPVFVDGGIRSGADVYKMLALGARNVLVGRPLLIAAAGGDEAGVRHHLERYGQELAEVMEICGDETPRAITNETILTEEGE